MFESAGYSAKGDNLYSLLTKAIIPPPSYEYFCARSSGVLKLYKNSGLNFESKLRKRKLNRYVGKQRDSGNCVIVWMT